MTPTLLGPRTAGALFERWGLLAPHDLADVALDDARFSSPLRSFDESLAAALVVVEDSVAKMPLGDAATYSPTFVGRLGEVEVSMVLERVRREHDLAVTLLKSRALTHVLAVSPTSTSPALERAALGARTRADLRAVLADPALTSARRPHHVPTDADLERALEVIFLEVPAPGEPAAPCSSSSAWVLTRDLLLAGVLAGLPCVEPHLLCLVPGPLTSLAQGLSLSSCPALPDDDLATGETTAALLAQAHRTECGSARLAHTLEVARAL